MSDLTRAFLYGISAGLIIGSIVPVLAYVIRRWHSVRRSRAQGA